MKMIWNHVLKSGRAQLNAPEFLRLPLNYVNLGARNHMCL
eukprot:SAG11_NODE_1101_length_5868_cov_2.045935_10_plen_40_part_00